MNRIYFILIFIFSLAINQDCETGFIPINEQCYFEQDINVLDTFIENSNGSINMILDINNNGIIEPLELCDQGWENGRIVLFDCYPIIINGNYNWLDVSGEIPNNITDWEYIEVFIMSYNDLSGLIPDSICELDLDFSDNSIFDLNGNALCPPYPTCIETYINNQDTMFSDCELNVCYNLGISDFISYELNGDNIVNPYDDLNGTGYLGINLFNNGPACPYYPGIRIQSNTEGVSFYGGTGTDILEFETWWYAIESQGVYGLNIPFEISPFIPEGTPITFTAEAVTLHCEEDCSESDDPYCNMCPITDPITLTLTVGSSFTNALGDANFDGQIDVLDVIELVSYVLNIGDYYSWDLVFLMTDLNFDYNLNIQDIILLVNIILDS